LAQRLVRAICPHCKTPSPVDEITLKELGEAISKSKEPPTFYRGKGCKQCKQSGYLGRTGIYELLTVNEKIKRLIAEKASPQEIRQVARETTGLKSLREDGLLKVLKGVTTRDEVDRVAYEMTFQA
jgi:type II secretory ATPase GspE/PulE/Tfp pilus assembly ATPase PilB-like protein